MRARLKHLAALCRSLLAAGVERARHALLLVLLVTVYYAGFAPAAFLRRAALGERLPPEERLRGWQPIAQQASRRETAFARAGTMLGYAARAARRGRWFAAALLLVLAPLAPLAAARRDQRVNPDLYVMF